MVTALYWISQGTKKELLLFLTFWEELSHEERQVYIWSDIQHQGSGWIGQQLGCADLEEHWITMCGNPPVYAPRSAQAQRILDSIEGKWRNCFQGSKLAAATEEPRALDRRPVVDIQSAFNDLIRALFGFDQEDMIHNWREERVKQQKQAMMDLALDIAHFLPRARTWIQKNSELFAKELNPTAPS